MAKLVDDQTQNKSPGQTIADAGVAGYDSAKNKSQKGGDKKGKGSGDSSGGSGNPWSILSYIPKLHSGGKVKKTGIYRLLKGEEVIPAKKGKSLKRKGSKHKRTSIKA